MSERQEPSVEAKLLASSQGGVGQIVFNNPARRNAVSLEMWARMSDLLSQFAADPALRVLVISGAGGKAFVSGADISKFESERASAEAQKRYSEIGGRAYQQLYNFPKPTIAKIQGYCIGGGMNLAACCDLRICSEDARFGVPAARLGLGYGATGVNRLAEIVGIAFAMEMFFTARQFTAEEALRIGLVNRVVPVGELDAAINEITGQICDNAPLTIAAIKAAARERSKPPGEQDLARVEALVEACFDSDDYIEGRRAFMEKRKPKFTGT